MQFYSLKKIKQKKATYNVIFGERSNGKTFACLKESLLEFKKTGKQMAYVRRWKEDVIGRRASKIWGGVNDSGIISTIFDDKYNSVHYRNGKFYLCNFKDGEIIYNEQTDLLGYTFALSDSEHDKSTSYPDVTTIIFDEFLTRQLYLVDEFVTFMNVLSTIIRHRTDVVIYMLGNTVNKFSPYFKEMGLVHVNQMEQGTIDLYRYGNSDLKVAVEYCSTLSKEKKNNHYFAFDNPKLNMITGGAWELDIYQHLPIKYTPKDVQLIYFIEFNSQTFQCEIIVKNNMMFTYIHEKTTPIKNENDIRYTLDSVPLPWYNDNILKPRNKIQEKILYFYKNNLVYYQNNSIGDMINNYLNICKRR